MRNRTVVYSIDLYQRYISPHKGYCCAYRFYSNKMSCSEFAKKCFMKYGFKKSFILSRHHLKKCKDIYLFEKKKDNKKEDSSESYCKECAIMPASCL